MLFCSGLPILPFDSNCNVHGLADASFLRCFVFLFVPKRRKLEGGALKAETAKYSTEVQQKEHKRKVPKATLRNKGQGVAKDWKATRHQKDD